MCPARIPASVVYKLLTRIKLPFTFAHPAIVLPLKRRFCNLSLTGLVIGSITPDFKYFIRMEVKSLYSHTAVGLFWFDLPMGILLAFIYHNLVRNFLLNNLPNYIFLRFAGFRTFNWNAYFRKNLTTVLLSLFIGIVSHILWDGFTHKSGFISDLFPWLKATIYPLGYLLPVYRLLQHLSTVAGILYIYFFVKALPAADCAHKVSSPYYWPVVFGTASAFFIAEMFARHWHAAAGSLIVIIISVLILGLLAGPLSARLKRQWQTE
ncbi:MAG: DUF4184 family protein [Bacteroidota bacterium]